MKQLKCIREIFLSVLVVIGVCSGLLSGAHAINVSSNLIANSQLTTTDITNPNMPADWSTGNWGTNSTTFSYLTNSGYNDSDSLDVQMTGYSSGDAKWYFAPVTVTAGNMYNYSDYYQSSVTTDVMAVFTNPSGTISYQDLGTAPASSSWAQYSENITVPTGDNEVTIYHLIEANGTLQTDDFSLSLISAPTVAISSPVSSSTISGSVNINATASDASGVSQVQFYLDGSALGSPLTSSPYTMSWNTATTANGLHNLTAVATNVNGISTTSLSDQVTVSNTVAVGANLIPNPSVLNASPSQPNLPTNWQTGTWGTNTTTFSYLGSGGYNGGPNLEVQTSKYTSGDSKWYFTPVSVIAGSTYTYSDYYQSSVNTDVMAVFSDASGNLSYLDLGSAPAGSSWTKYSASFAVPLGVQTVSIYHLLQSVGTLQTDDFSLVQATVPTVEITSPSADSDVTGSVQITANATDGSGVSRVQFYLDGSALGSPVTTAPYDLTWNSSDTTNGTHTLTAEVTNINGATATSSPISVSVGNSNPLGGNLIPNPGLSIATLGDMSVPQDWSADTWGTNTTTFSYLNSGYQSNNSVEVNVTSYTSGDSKWAFAPVPVAQNVEYKFSEYYESSVNTQIEAVFNMSDGSIIYQLIGQPQASSTWANFTTEFAIPLGTQSVTIYHLMQSVGTLTTSDFSMQPYTPTGFNRAIVSLTFDDGYNNQYTQTLPLLKEYGFESTQFIITGELNKKGYLSYQQIQGLYQAGNEIASHTVTHDDLTQESSRQLTSDLVNSQSLLDSLIGSKVTDFAYPYGLYDNAVTTGVKQYYSAARGIEDGFNSIDNFNAYDLKVQNVFGTTTTAQLSAWVAEAQSTNTWLIFCYHSVDPNPTSIDSGIYNITPTQLNSQLATIKTSGVAVETMSQALKEVTPQL